VLTSELPLLVRHGVLFFLYYIFLESNFLGVFCTAFGQKEILNCLAHGPIIQVLMVCLKEEKSLIPPLYSSGYLKPILLFTFCGQFLRSKVYPFAFQTCNITHIAYLGNFLAVHSFFPSYKNLHLFSSTAYPHLHLALD